MQKTSNPLLTISNTLGAKQIINRGNIREANKLTIQTKKQTIIVSCSQSSFAVSRISKEGEDLDGKLIEDIEGLRKLIEDTVELIIIHGKED